MIRIVGASLLSVACLVLWTQAQDPAPAPKDKEVKNEDAKKDDGKKDEVKKDAKEEEEKPAPPAEDPKKIIARLTKNYDEVDTELGDKKNPGESTQKRQKAIIDDLEKLINQQDDNNCNCNGGGGGGGSGQKGGGQGGGQAGGGQQGGGGKQGGGQQGGGQNAKNQGGAGNQGGGGQQGKDKNQGGGGQNAKNQGGNDKEQKQQNAGGGGQKDKKEEAKGSGMGGAANDTNKKDDNIADLVKQAWGHLPQKERDKMNAYSRDRLMPKYEELLRQYYRSIAAQEKRKDID